MKSELLKSLETIKSEIQREKERTSPSRLDSNYQGGVDLLDRLLEEIEGNEIEFPCDEMLASFNYYSSDSLPWSGGILKIIEEEYRKLRRLGILK